MFKVLTGDLFESRACAVVNAVNCVGVMGKSVALEVKVGPLIRRKLHLLPIDVDLYAPNLGSAE